MFDLHVHTTFCDGNASPEDMVKAAMVRGLDTVGFSGHSFTPFDRSYCMTEEATHRYQEEIARLKTVYAGKITVLCGVEQDYEAPPPAFPYDHIIGSVHYVKCGDIYIPADGEPCEIADGVKTCFNGDIYALIEAYFAAVGDVKKRTNCDVVGHVDVIAKYNGDGSLFDETHPRYINAWRCAVDRLLDEDAVFEINTSPLYRRARPDPYPALPILEYLGRRHAKVVLSSDSHKPEMLGYGFAQWRERAKKMGLVVLERPI